MLRRRAAPASVSLSNLRLIFVFLILSLFTGLVRSQRQGQANIVWYVATTGTSSKDCTTGGTEQNPFQEITQAVACSSQGDAVEIAGGSYTCDSILSITHDLTLRGYQGSLPTLKLSTKAPWMAVSGAISLTLDSLKFTGSASNQGVILNVPGIKTYADLILTQL